MNKADIKKILKNPSNELVELMLGYVNLTNKEKEIINYCYRQGLTEEQTAEKMDISVRGLQDIKRVAIEKLNSVWSYNYIIAIVMKEVDV